MKKQLKSDQLRTFLAVAQQRNFTRAAHMLHLTQAAVSMQIRQLELDIEAPLFVRSPRQLTLTPAGETLQVYAERIQELHEQTWQALSCATYERSLRIGTPDAYASLVLPAALRAFTLQFPTVQVEVVCLPTLELGRRLESGSLDLAIGTCCPQFPGPPVYSEELVWVVASSATELAAERPLPLAMFEVASAPRAHVVHALESASIPYRCVYSSPDTMGILACAQAGNAIAAVPKQSVGGKLRIIGLQEGLPDLAPLEITIANGRTQNGPEKRALMDLLTAPCICPLDSMTSSYAGASRE